MKFNTERANVLVRDQTTGSNGVVRNASWHGCGSCEVCAWHGNDVHKPRTPVPYVPAPTAETLRHGDRLHRDPSGAHDTACHTSETVRRMALTWSPGLIGRALEPHIRFTAGPRVRSFQSVASTNTSSGGACVLRASSAPVICSMHQLVHASLCWYEQCAACSPSPRNQRFAAVSEKSVFPFCLSFIRVTMPRLATFG